MQSRSYFIPNLIYAEQTAVRYLVYSGRFEQQLKQKLSQKCSANQSEESFLVKAFKFFDYSETGEVDFPTFEKAIAKMGVVVDSKELENYFRVYDRNGNGSLDYKEFSEIVFGKKEAPQGSGISKFKGTQE